MNDRVEPGYEPLPAQRDPTSRAAHVAAVMLLVATVAWGFGFTWAKAGQEAVNRAAGLGAGAALGPILFLAWRFFAAGVVLIAIVPRARRGWSIASAGRALVLGGLVGVGMILQHLGLDRSTEAVTAFLTSLTILFVPLLMTFALRRPPAAIFWVAVVLATAGIWLMTGATPAGFGLGELYGLLCAVVFSFYLIAINLLVPRDDPWRMTAGQFMVAGVIALGMCLFVERGPQALRAGAMFSTMRDWDVWFNLLLLIVFPTLGSYTIMNLYQPRVDPTRAALIYLMEPIFAAAYAWVMRGSGLAPIALAGAALIIAANLLVEFLNARNTAKRR